MKEAPILKVIQALLTTPRASTLSRSEDWGNYFPFCSDTRPKFLNIKISIINI